MWVCSLVPISVSVSNGSSEQVCVDGTLQQLPLASSNSPLLKPETLGFSTLARLSETLALVFPSSARTLSSNSRREGGSGIRALEQPSDDPRLVVGCSHSCWLPRSVFGRLLIPHAVLFLSVLAPDGELHSISVATPLVSALLCKGVESRWGARGICGSPFLLLTTA